MSCRLTAPLDGGCQKSRQPIVCCMQPQAVTTVGPDIVWQLCLELSSTLGTVMDPLDYSSRHMRFDRFLHVQQVCARQRYSAFCWNWKCALAWHPTLSRALIMRSDDLESKFLTLGHRRTWMQIDASSQKGESGYIDMVAI